MSSISEQAWGTTRSLREPMRAFPGDWLSGVVSDIRCAICGERANTSVYSSPERQEVEVHLRHCQLDERRTISNVQMLRWGHGGELTTLEHLLRPAFQQAAYWRNRKPPALLLFNRRRKAQTRRVG